ncbi:hypothetical protein J4402_02160 [Candidatus Pacearchaeota archaeon]|nr:hypothetical protein [uncultured archaeon]AQS31865.1 hypothetical protein [uncultured archaeon]MBS3088562.1 hypothetical protein [Candidatus Pacearchaeota archaeon]
MKNTRTLATSALTSLLAFAGCIRPTISEISDADMTSIKQIGPNAIYRTYKAEGAFLQNSDGNRIELFSEKEKSEGNHRSGYLPEGLPRGIYGLWIVDKKGKKRFVRNYEIDSEKNELNAAE